MTQYFKIVNASENHHNLQYQTGLNIDPIPFQKEGSCVPGGIYFTTIKHILKFLNMGIYLREVTIPEYAEMIEDPEGEKWRASKVILGERKDLCDVSTWEYLISVGADIHAENDEAIRWASLYGHIEVVKYLVSIGADIHANNNYAIRLASKHGHLEVVKYLVSIGADIHADNDYAIRYASEKGYLEVVKYLVSIGADIHALNDEAIRYASLNGHLEIVKYLVSLGADIHADNDYAIRYASLNGHLEIVKYLKSI